MFFHIDKLDITPESISEKKDIYMKTLSNLINRAFGSFYIDKIVFVAVDEAGKPIPHGKTEIMYTDERLRED